MSTSVQHVYFALVLCFSVAPGICFLYGQSSISGTVTYGSGEAAAFARVSLHLTEGDILYKGTYADSTGYYSLNNIYFPDTLILKVNQLGYEPYAKPVLLAGKTDVQLNPFINTNGNDLPTATVKESRVAFTIRGDTISFNPQAYLVGNERTLGDLIKNIPELELTANGEVKFKGKKVTGVLVEGFDVFNGQQKSATEDFSIEHILSIDIIENYRGAGDFMTGDTDKVVLDVKLKGGSKRKWIGRHEIGFTPTGQWNATSGITKASRKAAINFKVTTNSIGQAALSSKDYLNTKSSLNDAVGEQTGQFTLDDLLPAGILPPQGLAENKELMLSAGYDYRKLKKFNLKGSLMSVLGDRNAARSFERFVIDAPAQNRIVGDEQAGQDLNFFFLNLKLEEKVGKGDSSSKFVALLDVNREKSSINLQQETQEEALNYRGIKTPTSLDFRLQWRGAVKRTINSKAYFNHSRDRLESTSHIQGTGQRQFTVEGPFSQRIEQFSTRTNERYEGVLTQQITNTRWWFFLKSSMYHDRFAQESISESIALLSKDGKAKEWGVVLDGRIKWTEKKISLTVTNSSSLLNRSSVDTHRQLLTRKTSIFIKLQPHTFHYGLLQVFNNELPAADLASSLGTYDIIDARAVNFNNALPFEMQRTNGLAFSYFNRNFFVPRLTLLTTAGVSSQRNGQLRIVVPRGDFFHYIYTGPNDASTLNFANRLMIPILKGVSFSWDSQLSRTRQQNENFPGDGITIRSFNNSLNFRFAKVGDFGLSLKGSWLARRQKILTQDIRFAERSVSVSVNYTAGKFRASLEGGQRFSGISDQANFTNALLNADIAYSLGKGKWEVFVRGQNILQLSPTPRFGNIATANEVESYRFTDFPGYVLVGMERLF